MAIWLKDHYNFVQRAVSSSSDSLKNSLLPSICCLHVKFSSIIIPRNATKVLFQNAKYLLGKATKPIRL